MAIYEIKKSKFISYLFNINSKEEAKEILNNLRKEHPKAKHIVYAYLINNDLEISNGYTDDREPKGVAGIPLYKLLENKNLTNKGIFIVRYFGGIELGKSNLLRAYLTSAKLVLE
ncbi:proline dipeptidase pepQ [Metamycoplasma cloacale]|uniref:YigZ family protein n=1 Tax=Metamycoplasma cloacale TaxID=92401 RepID=A0A2Z4LM13_9BACT|nr:YigZ family protein [Metamycoplasma cloacale]AWX42769.1 YigZ family protein [Metamycoplasma cloacale]VEU79416.1 proline dipeptidase pepQ [Metamycoplasma cloacale]